MNKYESYESDSTSQMLSFLCGAIVGAAAALLFAPMRGNEMRASIGDAARQGKSRLREYGEVGKEWAQERAGEASRAARSALDQAKGTAQNAADTARDAVSTGADRMSDTVDRASSALDDAVSAESDLDRPADPFPSDRPRGQWS